MTATLWDLSHCLFSNLQNTFQAPRSCIFKSMTLLATRMVSLCLFWCKNTLLFLISHFFLWTFYVSFDFMAHKNSPCTFCFRPQNCTMPYLDIFRQGFLPVCAQLSWRPSLNSVLLRHLRDLLFREADIQSRLSGSWLALRGGWRNKSPNVAWMLTKPAAVDWLWPPCWDALIRPWSQLTVSSFLYRKFSSPS